jgi:DNA-binding NtrC family response regulator
VSRILVVDDEPAIGAALTSLLESAGHSARWVATGAAALAAVKEEPTDLALVDLRLGHESGLDLLAPLKDLRAEMSVIVVTALATIETAVDAMQRGADNFVTKPVDPKRLLAVIAKGLDSERLRRRSAQLDRLSPPPSASPVARAPAMQEVMRLAEAVAPRPTTVLLVGPTGSGKGMLARLIHERSPRAAQPFVQLNCAGLSRELTESELFGHEKGAFTGATARKIGLFEAAGGGTLFLDEVGEMDLAVQAKLLKVLEEKRFRRLGGLAEVAVDARLIAATHVDLGEAVSRGRFRSDLFYRLNVFAIALPPLSERRAEVVPLALRFLRELSGVEMTLAPEAVDVLEAYSWPGNVRELRNVMERAVILCADASVVEPEHLPPLDLDEPAREEVELPIALSGSTMAGAERSFLENALRANDGNIVRTARSIGISRGMLYRKIRKYGL